jgi:hypothetical protein
MMRLAIEPGFPGMLVTCCGRREADVRSLILSSVCQQKHDPVVEPMIDLHQPLHDTKMIEMLRCHLDVPLGKKVQWS